MQYVKMYSIFMNQLQVVLLSLFVASICFFVDLFINVPTID